MTRFGVKLVILLQYLISKKNKNPRQTLFKTCLFWAQYAQIVKLIKSLSGNINMIFLLSDLSPMCLQIITKLASLMTPVEC